MAGNRFKHPTIHDVAQKAGVSKSLVSLVMRESPHVSDDKRAAVMEAAAELGYRPNAVARSLVRQRSGVFGCVLSDLHNPFFADVADGIEEVAFAQGYRTLLSSGFLDAERESIAIDTLLQMRVDALIMLGTLSSIDEMEKAARTVPVVVVGRTTASPFVDSVHDDGEAGANLVVDHLVGLGHSRIAHISGGRGAGAAPRLAGYEAAMRRHGLGGEISIVEGAFTRDGGRSGMDTLLAGPHPTAVFAPNDYAAYGALESLDGHGLKVPEDVSVIGYDNLAFSRIGRIDLTTVAQPSRALGQHAMELVMERVTGLRDDARHVVLAPELIVGSTTAGPVAS